MTSVPSALLHVWLADLDRLQEELAAAEAQIGLLSASEQAWSMDAARLDLQVRRRRRLARIGLRLLLVRHGAREARGQELVVDARGKPGLASRALAFNVAHCGAVALYAIGSRGPLGVDLETDRTIKIGPPRRDLILAAGRGLVEGASSGKSETADFLMAWTRLEALAKARGDGIGVLLTELGITASGAAHVSTAEVASRAMVLRAAAGLDVADLDAGPGRYAALAAADIGTVRHGVRELTPAECLGLP